MNLKKKSLTSKVWCHVQSTYVEKEMADFKILWFPRFLRTLTLSCLPLFPLFDFLAFGFRVPCFLPPCLAFLVGCLPWFQCEQSETFHEQLEPSCLSAHSSLSSFASLVDIDYAGFTVGVPFITPGWRFSLRVESIELVNCIGSVSP